MSVLGFLSEYVIRVTLWWNRLTLLSNLRWVCDHIDSLFEQLPNDPSVEEDIAEMKRVKESLVSEINEINRALSRPIGE